MLWIYGRACELQVCRVQSSRPAEPEEAGDADADRVETSGQGHAAAAISEEPGYIWQWHEDGGLSGGSTSKRCKAIKKVVSLRRLLDTNLPAWLAMDDSRVSRWLGWLRREAKQLAEQGPERSDLEAEAARMEFDELEDLAGQAQKEVAASKRKSWHDWVITALGRGAKKAHQFTQESVKWKAQTTMLEDGRVTADPLRLLLKERKQWKQIWIAVDDHEEQGDDDKVRQRVREKLGKSNKHLPCSHRIRSGRWPASSPQTQRRPTMDTTLAISACCRKAPYIARHTSLP